MYQIFDLSDGVLRNFPLATDANNLKEAEEISVKRLISQIRSPNKDNLPLSLSQ